ncbi:sunset domain-containing protein [Amycolatopsis sp. NPDC005003]
MSIFGQVWLWSLAAFFVGVVLTWLVLVLPLRKSVRRLESSLAQAHADAARTPANADVVRGTEAFRRPEPEPSRQETSYPGTLVAAPPIHRDDVHDDIDEDFAELDAQVPSRMPPTEPFIQSPEPEAGEGDPYRSAATQFLAPDEEPDRGAPTQYLAPVGDSFDDEPESPALSRLEQKLDSDPAGSLFQPPAGEAAPAPDWFDDEPPSERSAFEEPVERTRFITEHPGSVDQHEPEEDEPPQYAFGGDIAESELDVPPETPAEATQVLPKRQPREAARGGFDTPQPIQPSMRTVERREPDLSGAHSGSLFEPSVQPNQAAAAAGVAAPEPPPARQAAGDAVPPGPFGPGSAMPRPGGGAPSDSFAVKASVTALRYCTEESAQFPKMVAEVWFRTAEDAERVGFRPLS